MELLPLHTHLKKISHNLTLSLIENCLIPHALGEKIGVGIDRVLDYTA